MKGRTVTDSEKRIICMDSQGYASDARDGATSHTACKTVNLLQENRVNVLAIKFTDLIYRIDHIWDVISCVVRRR